MNPAVNLFHEADLPATTLQTVRRIAFGRGADPA